MRNLFEAIGVAVRDLVPVPYVGSGPSLSLSIPFRSTSGAEAQMRAMSANGTLFAIVDKSATACASVDWHLYRKARSGKEEDRTEVTAHAALDLWNKPNDFYTRQELVETGQQHYELTGEEWWVVGRDPRSTIPMTLWPVRPDRMEPVPSHDNFLVGYFYHGPEGEEVPLDLDQVIQQRRPNPLDPYRGLSPVVTALLDLEADRAAAEWNRAFFRNSAEPGGVVEIERRLSDAEFKQHQLRWAEQHRGASNAHRVALLEGGMKWVERKYTMRDMEFTSLRNIAGEKIREAMGFPKPLLGTVEDVNRANAEAAEYVFAKWWCVPRLERRKGALNNDLLPLFGEVAATTLEFDYDSPVDEDSEKANAQRDSQVAAAKTLMDAGFEPAAALEAVGLPDMPIRIVTDTEVAPEAGDGETQAALAELVAKINVGVNTVVTWQEAREFLAAAGMALDLTEPAPAVPAPPGAPGEGEESPPAGGPPVPGRRAPAEQAAHAARIRAQLRAADDEPRRQDWEVRLDTLAEAWSEDVTPLQVDELVAQVESIVQAGTPADLADLACSDQVAAGLLGDAMLAQAAAAGRRMALSAAAQGVAISPCTPIEPTPSAAKPKAVKYLAGLAADLQAAAGLTARFLSSGLSMSAAKEALRVWNPGALAADVAGAVRSHLQSLTDAALRTELGAAIWAAENEGRGATLEQAEADGKGASYMVADEERDRSTCSPCEKIDGKRYDTLGEAMADYPFGGYRLCEGRSRCRGTYVAYWD